MVRKIVLVLALAVVAGVVAAGVVAASSAKTAATPAGERFIDHTVKSTFVDNGHQGFSRGDQIFFHDNLKQHDKTEGTLDGVCNFTLTDAHDAWTHCTATARLSGGQIELQAGGLNIGIGTFKVGITGGTGSYRNASGYVVIKHLSDANSVFTLYVE